LSHIYLQILYSLEQPLWIDIGKCILIMLMVVLAFVCLLIFLNFRRWHADLSRQEHTANRLRDDVMFNFTATRARLGGVRERISERSRAPASRVTEELVKGVGSALMMVIQKERSVFQWGMLGLRVGQAAVQLWKRARKN